VSGWLVGAITGTMNCFHTLGAVWGLIVLAGGIATAILATILIIWRRSGGDES